MRDVVRRLSPEDEERIRLEEIYRREVQQEIYRREEQQSPQEKPSRWNKLGSYANSPVGVVVLSSIVIAGATWAIRDAVEHRNEARQSRLATQRLSAEIDARLNYFLIAA